MGNGSILVLGGKKAMKKGGKLGDNFFLFINKQQRKPNIEVVHVAYLVISLGGIICQSGALI